MSLAPSRQDIAEGVTALEVAAAVFPSPHVHDRLDLDRGVAQQAA
jgi:hypothetical protein